MHAAMPIEFHLPHDHLILDAFYAAAVLMTILGLTSSFLHPGACGFPIGPTSKRPPSTISVQSEISSISHLSRRIDAVTKQSCKRHLPGLPPTFVSTFHNLAL